MGTYRRHVGALLWRNLLYRRRGWLGAIVQLLLPPAMIAILVAIKFALKDSRTFKPQTIAAIYPKESIKPFSFQDYVTGVISPRKCVKKPSYFSNGRRRDFLFQRYSIEGINPYEWANPFFKVRFENLRETGI